MIYILTDNNRTSFYMKVEFSQGSQTLSHIGFIYKSFLLPKEDKVRQHTYHTEPTTPTVT